MANQKKIKIQGFKFKPFSEKQLKILTCWQDNSPVKDKFLIIADGSIRSGKEQPLSSKLYTPNGYKLMRDIIVGDYVFDRQGNPTKVIGIFPQGKKDVYEITFCDGSKTRCGIEHLWTYEDNGTFLTKTLAELMKEDYSEFKFPINGCVEFKERKTDSVTYVKFIPDDYKYNSKENRLQYLAHLLNIHGRVLSSNFMTYYNISKQLMDDVAELARSLGLYVDTNHSEIQIQINKELYEKLISIHQCKLTITDEKLWKTIKSIKYIGQEECQCIYVDNEEHLYLTDDFIVTHNTVCMALSFVLFVMTNFNQQNAAMCGKSVGSFRRNVLATLKQMMIAIGYEVIEHRSENYVEIINGEVVNYFYIFGGKSFLATLLGKPSSK